MLGKDIEFHIFPLAANKFSPSSLTLDPLLHVSSLQISKASCSREIPMTQVVAVDENKSTYKDIGFQFLSLSLSLCLNINIYILSYKRQNSKHHVYGWRELGVRVKFNLFEKTIEN